MTITCLPVRKGSLMITVASMLSVPLIVIKESCNKIMSVNTMYFVFLFQLITVITADTFGVKITNLFDPFFLVQLTRSN